MKGLMKMKAMVEKAAIAVMVAVGSLMAGPAATALASDKSLTPTPTATPEKKNVFMEVAEPIVRLIDNLFAPAMAIVVAAGTLYCVILGVKFAKAEEPQEHEKAKNHLKNAILGFVLIFILVVALKLSVGPLTEWMTDPSKMK